MHDGLWSKHLRPCNLSRNTQANHILPVHSLFPHTHPTPSSRFFSCRHEKAQALTQSVDTMLSITLSDSAVHVRRHFEINSVEHQ
ncbi:hypothetical protein DOTSEDRAFT_73072 [Dothistroma septosporum NZE10]|uniref:Uncharacterized protein n=1 Tax=Dothistroma septosporum (strain NZE10 / CBS 128990) TaxID=675120 RepID=N1PIG0_DOTSN|nr:hypothetical protein DOTSEDRAFT_73072 [Dothistroma septosporum NZE10]